MISFIQNLKSNIYSKKSLLCVGLDIAPENIQSNNIQDLIDHSKVVIDATRNSAIAYKKDSGGIPYLSRLLNPSIYHVINLIYHQLVLYDS